MTTPMAVPGSAPQRSLVRRQGHTARSELGWLVACYVALTAVWTGAGLLLTGPLEDSAVVRLDERVERWFVQRRTESRDDWAHWGAMLSDTYVKIVVTAILAAVFWYLWRRWLEPVLMASALIVEAAAFMTITTIVGRPRPDVPQLESSPVDSSFPSGHTAAAVAYGALVVIVWRHTRNGLARWGTVVLVGIVGFVVGVARIYQGMHHLSDTIAGALLGAASVALVSLVLLRDERSATAPDDRHEAPLPATHSPTPHAR